MNISTAKRVPSQQIAGYEFSIPTPFIFHVITEKQKRAFVTGATNFTENLIYISINSLPFEKHSEDFYSIPLVREHLDSFPTYTHFKTCESSFADLPFTLVFKLVKNIITGTFSTKINPKPMYLPIQDVLVHF